MKQAGEAMDPANAASDHCDSADKIDKLAYLAKQKIALTQEAPKQKSAAADVTKSAKERDQMRLAQRTNEADKAKAKAKAKADALRANQAAQAALDEAALAQRRTDEVQRANRESQAHATQLEAQLAELSAKKTERGIVITRGDGQSNPVASNETAQSRQLNRRVEIVLSEDGGKVSQR